MAAIERLRVEHVQLFAELLSSTCVKEEVDFWMRTLVWLLEARCAVVRVFLFCSLSWNGAKESDSHYARDYKNEFEEARDLAQFYSHSKLLPKLTSLMKICKSFFASHKN